MSLREEYSQLLEKDWSEDEKGMIKRILDNLMYYQKMMPKALKDDVISALRLCTRLKTELEEAMHAATDTTTGLLL